MAIAYATTKLTEDDVREIRKLREWGWKLDELAHDYGVSQQTIKDIVSRRTWKNVG